MKNLFKKLKQNMRARQQIHNKKLTKK